MDAPLTLLKLENVGALQKLIKMETTYPEKVFTDCVKRSVPTINQVTYFRVFNGRTVSKVNPKKELFTIFSVSIIVNIA